MSTRFRLLDSGPFRFGFIATVGVLLALALGLAVGSLSGPITLIFFALFVSLGLDPVVKRFERWGMPKWAAILSVMVAFLLVVTLLLWIVLPVVIDQAVDLVTSLPRSFDELQQRDWFISANTFFGGALVPLLDWIQTELAKPDFWITISGGALRVGINLINGVFGTIFVIALTLYFIASMDSMKSALYDLVPQSRRTSVSELTEEITGNVGNYLSGMFILAVINAVVTFIVLTIVGVPWAPLLAAIALPITFIPLVGSVISWILASSVAFLTSPTAGFVTLLVILVYMQFEAYFLTPKVLGKAIKIPGAVVVIGAMVGGTLLGLLGALVACPVSAALLLIVKKVIVPRQKLT
jgi:predicted PurR-regulated permease PerM